MSRKDYYSWDISTGGAKGVDGSSVDNSVILQIDSGTFNVNNTALEAKIQALTDLMAGTTTQHIIKVTASGNLPNNTKGYLIINLGVTPNSADNSYNDFIVDGSTIPSNTSTIENKAEGVSVFGNTISYDPNGNTLMIIYNTAD